VRRVVRPGRAHGAAAPRVAGEDTFIWASDFPHSDAKYPGVVDELLERTEGMEAGARAKLVGGNAVGLYGLGHIAR
jgi:predicted TIM-barrel fold metal-dependent hydrolase